MRRFVLAAIVVLAAGCFEPTGPPSHPGPEPHGEPVAFRTLLLSRDVELLAGSFQGELSAREWNETWARYAAAHDPRPAQPTVDPARERIFAVALGPFGTNCHDVRITNATLEPDGLRVIWYDELNAEGADRVCGASMSWPTHVIALETDTYWSFSGQAYGPEDAWPHAPPPGPHVERLSPRTLAKGSFSGIHNDTRLLLRDAEGWEALWSEHARGEQAPAVEWGNESVVAVVVPGPTGCGAMHLGNLTYDADARVTTVEVVMEVVGPEIQCFVAFQDVYHFVAIPARGGEARFEERNGPPRE